MSDFYKQILNLQIDKERAAFADRTPRDISAYKAGYRDARHAAAEIALEADQRIEELEGKIAARELAIRELEKRLTEQQQATIAADRRIEAAKAVLAAVETWMASESGPLFALWENGEVGAYEYDDGGDIDWPQTLANIRDLNCPEEQLGCDGAPVEVGIYRQVYGLLMAAKEGR